MKKALLMLMLLPSFGWAGSGTALDHVDIDLSDKAALQRGAQAFTQYCLNCHSAAYMRYNRIGKDLGISDEDLYKGYMHAGTKLGDTMKVAMLPEDAKRWFGTTPPDLSVIARARGTDWLYTYLRSFYLDSERPTGVNNRVFKDVAMPHVLWELQGLRQAVFAQAADGSRHIERFNTVTPGKLSEAQYDAFVRDLVAYLAYMGEPAKTARIELAPWVLGFLVLFFVVLYLLKKEMWKDVR